MRSSDSLPHPARVAVVTVSYGSEAVLPAFLDSVKTSSNHRLALLVVDNRPETDSAVKTMTEASGGSYLPLPTNRGYGAAVNAAVESLPDSVEWILISNPDVVLSALSVDRLLNAVDTHPDAGAIGPAVYTADGTLYPSARSIPSLRTGLGHALFANLWTTNPWSREYRQEQGSSTAARSAGWLSGACLLVRRSAFESLGGFDPRFFMYFEDVDLGWRLGKAGWTNIYQPDISVVHTGAHSTDRDSAAMTHAHHESARMFLDQKYAGLLLIPLRAALRLSLAVRSSFVRRRLQREARR